MQDRKIVEFLTKVHHTLDWSALDADTKDVLRHLMNEVARLVRESSTK